MRAAKLALLAYNLASPSSIGTVTAFVAPTVRLPSTSTTSRSIADSPTCRVPTCKCTSTTTATASTTSLTCTALPIDAAASALSSASTLLSTAGDAAAASTTQATTSSQLTPLTTYLLEQLISAGIPALFWIVVIAFASRSIASAAREDREERMGGAGGGIVQELYDDLYGDGDDSKSSPFGGGFGRRGSGRPSKKNLGIPGKEYIKVTRLNDRYDSYGYTLTSATRSKSLAAAQLRATTFDRALGKSIGGALTPLTSGEKTDLIRVEKELLMVGGKIVGEMSRLQRKMTNVVIQEEMKSMNVEVGELDAEGDGGEYVQAKEEEGIIIDVEVEGAKSDSSNATDSASSADGVEDSSKDGREKTGKAKVKEAGLKSMLKTRSLNKDLTELSKLNIELTKLELAFVRSVIEILGPERANGVRAAILGNQAGGTAAAGTLLKSLQERPLKSVLSSIGYGEEGAEGRTKKLFVADFPGDVSASQVETLREEVTAIVRSAQPGDEALVVLQSGGGTVTGYGLAAAQLARFKAAGMKLTICVEQVAASGGYMMACVADQIVASPFAVLGSIGVISDVPNFYQRLKDEGIEFQTITAGKYKRTVTPTKKVTNEDIKKSKEDVEDILKLFKTFVHGNRPQLDIDSVATGETWFGTDALDRGLCDHIATADDTLVNFVDKGYDVYEVKYDPEPEFRPRLLGALPVGQAEGGGAVSGLITSAVGWAVRSVVPLAKQAVEEAMEEMVMEQNSSSSAKRYMMKDPSDTNRRVKAQD